MKREKPEVMMERLPECLSHLSGKLKALFGVNESAKKKTLIAEFCGTQSKSVSRWLGKQMLPKGEMKIRLMFFLDLLGYKLIELYQMAPVSRNFAELLGYQLMTAKEAAKLLEYKSSRDDCDSLYRFLFREDVSSKSNSKRRQLIYDAWTQKREELVKRKEEAEEKYYKAFAKVILPSDPPTLSVVRPPPEEALQQALQELLPGSQVIATEDSPPVIHIMAGLKGLLEHGGSESRLDNLSQPDLQVVVGLSGLLGSLSARLVEQDLRREAESGT